MTIQLASHLDVFYTVEFSFKSNGSQWRSTCVFGEYILVNLREFFEECEPEIGPLLKIVFLNTF